MLSELRFTKKRLPPIIRTPFAIPSSILVILSEIEPIKAQDFCLTAPRGFHIGMMDLPNGLGAGRSEFLQISQCLV